MKSERVWKKVVGTAATVLLAGTPAWAEIEINNRLPCPNGACVPNRMTFGYYPTRWRKWPVTSAPAPGPEAAARGGVQAPPTSEPPATAEDEVRSPFERLPRPQTQAPAEEDGFEPMPGGAGPSRGPGDDAGNGGPGNGGRGNNGGGNDGGGGQGGGGRGAPRRPTPIFQRPQGNPLPESRRPIPDGTRAAPAEEDESSLALEPPARLVPPRARPVSYATSAERRPSPAPAPAVRQAATPARSGAPASNPLRKAPSAARPKPAAADELHSEEEGPQIVPTAAWIEEVAADSADPATIKPQWRANPLRGR